MKMAHIKSTKKKVRKDKNVSHKIKEEIQSGVQRVL